MKQNQYLISVVAVAVQAYWREFDIKNIQKKSPSIFGRAFFIEQNLNEHNNSIYQFISSRLCDGRGGFTLAG